MSHQSCYFFISISLLFLLPNCAANQDLHDMKQAKAAYKACRAANTQDPGACKHEKENYEAAGQAYDSLKP